MESHEPQPESQPSGDDFEVKKSGETPHVQPVTDQPPDGNDGGSGDDDSNDGDDQDNNGEDKDD